MFGDLNQVELIGNITNEVNVRFTGTGTAVTSFGIATNRNYKDGKEGDWKEEVTFHNVVVWGREAEGLAQRAKKGTRIYIQGRLQTRTWDDNDGKKNYKTEIVAEKVILLDRYERGQSDNAMMSGGSSEKPAAKKSAPVQDDIISNNQVENGDINPDDLPF